MVLMAQMWWANPHLSPPVTSAYKGHLEWLTARDFSGCLVIEIGPSGYLELTQWPHMDCKALFGTFFRHLNWRLKTSINLMKCLNVSMKRIVLHSVCLIPFFKINVLVEPFQYGKLKCLFGGVLNGPEKNVCHLEYLATLGTLNPIFNFWQFCQTNLLINLWNIRKKQLEIGSTQKRYNGLGKNTMFTACAQPSQKIGYFPVF